MSKVAFLSRDAILKVQDIETRELEIPEWGGSVLVRGMTGHERDRYENSLYKQRGKDRQLNTQNARAKLVVLCTVDAEGNRLFDDKDINALAQKSSKALDRIFAVAMELSGIHEEDMGELTKNSEETSFDD
jgi:hypothetical protein